MTEQLCALMRVLSKAPRVDILQSLARAGAQPDHELATGVGLVPYEIQEAISALHENGIIEQQEDGSWRLAHRVQIERDGTCIKLSMEVPDGSMLGLHFGQDA